MNRENFRSLIAQSDLAQGDCHTARTAVVDAQGSFTYGDLRETSLRIAAGLLAGRDDLAEERVAFLLTPGFPWVATQWGIWKAGGVAVPLPVNSPKPELEYVLDDTRASILIWRCSIRLPSSFLRWRRQRGIRGAVVI